MRVSSNGATRPSRLRTEKVCPWSGSSCASRSWPSSCSCSISSDFILRLPTAFYFGGKSLVRDTRAKKIPRHSRGSEGGLKNNKLDFSLILSMARQLPASHNAGLDEREQAGLLASRSSY